MTSDFQRSPELLSRFCNLKIIEQYFKALGIQGGGQKSAKAGGEICIRHFIRAVHCLRKGAMCFLHNPP